MEKLQLRQYEIRRIRIISYRVSLPLRTRKNLWSESQWCLTPNNSTKNTIITDVSCSDELKNIFFVLWIYQKALKRRRHKSSLDNRRWGDKNTVSDELPSEIHQKGNKPFLFLHSDSTTKFFHTEGNFNLCCLISYATCVYNYLLLGSFLRLLWMVFTMMMFTRGLKHNLK